MADPDTLTAQIQQGRFDPSAPAAAAAAPDSPTVPTPQEQPQPTSEPQAPPPAPAPAVPGADSPAPKPEDAVAAQRVADAQRKMHEATTTAKAAQAENVGLRAEVDTLKATLASVVMNPEYQPVQVPPVPAPADDDKAWQEYTAVPQGDDKAAFDVLLKNAADRAERKIQTNLSAQRAHAANQQRGQALAMKVHETISATVAQIAPDVPVKLFWSNGAQAQRETPYTITDPLERIAWQTERAITLSRADLKAMQPPTSPPVAAEAAAVVRTAAPIMTGGSQTTGAMGGGAPGAPKTMVEQLRTFQGTFGPGSA